MLTIAALGMGGCAQRPQQMAMTSHGKEYFPSSIYGAASRRVIADGQPVPHGGGQYLVGKPYTIAGQTYVPSERRVVQVGAASWYGDAFHGRLTANGEIYDRDAFTAAHPTMPLPSYARVTNLRNNYSMIVRVNDRGPYHSNRIMDVSRRVAETLDFKRYGTAKIKVEYVGRASLAGSDDAKLYATLRTNGPALWQPEPTMVAQAEQPRVHVASIAPYVPEPRAASRVEAPPRRYSEAEPARLAPWTEARPRHERPRLPAIDHLTPARDVNIRRAERHDFASLPERAPRANRHERAEPQVRLSMREEPRERRRAPALSPLGFVPPPRPERMTARPRPTAAHMMREPGVLLPPERPSHLSTSAATANRSGPGHRASGLRMARSRDE